MAQSRFITFEGGEGAGKSTQVRLLAQRLGARGIKTALTREPGGAPQAEVIRDLLVTGDVDRWSPEAEVLLNYAARDDHLRNTIRPALSAGQWVLCDRFADSTRAYQGMAGGVGLDTIEAIHAQVVGDADPDLTFIMDLEPEIGLGRVDARGDANRFENRGLEFHLDLREAFLALARRFADRCVIVDASGGVEEVADEIFKRVEERLLSG